MLDGNTQVICWDSSLFNVNDSALDDPFFKIVGRDRNGHLFPTRVIQRVSTANETNWRTITANSVTIICTLDTQFLTTSSGWKTAATITTSDSIYGLSGTNTYSFLLGGAPSHVAIANQYFALYTSFAVTTSSSYSQTATAYGLKSSVGHFFANRFLVRGE